MGWLGRLLAAALLAIAGASAAAADPVTSQGPQGVSVTVYRDPDRPAAQAMQLSWLNGYALVTETRRVRIPAGETDIRFEGVAGGILPETAIVSGLPGGAVEKNQDAYLLAPSTLLDRSLGRRVHLRRTTVKTGTVREQEAIVRSGADGAVVLQTTDGFEALRCTGLKETLVYDAVPPGLSAKPTLSVRTRSPEAADATVTLSYLASGFDWQANYVATLDPSGTRLDLFTWVTLASSDETSFVAADTQAVAGHPNHDNSRRYHWTPPLSLRCWPSGTTSDLPDDQTIIVTGSRVGRANFAGAPPPPPPPPPPPAPAPAAMEARQEALGDLKLYRIPEPVTVAANAQKQVAMFHRAGVAVRQIYRTRIGSVANANSLGIVRLLALRNRLQDGLGLPMPAGRLVLFGEGRDRPLLLGEGFVEDKAVGEDVEIELSDTTGVVARLTRGADFKWELVVSNDHDAPIAYEARFPSALKSRDKHLRTKDERSTWRVLVPANGRATLRFEV